MKLEDLIKIFKPEEAHKEGENKPQIQISDDEAAILRKHSKPLDMILDTYTLEDYLQQISFQNIKKNERYYYIYTYLVSPLIGHNLLFYQFFLDEQYHAILQCFQYKTQNYVLDALEDSLKLLLNSPIDSVKQNQERILEGKLEEVIKSGAKSDTNESRSASEFLGKSSELIGEILTVNTLYRCRGLKTILTDQHDKEENRFNLKSAAKELRYIEAITKQPLHLDLQYKDIVYWISTLFTVISSAFPDQIHLQGQIHPQGLIQHLITHIASYQNYLSSKEDQDDKQKKFFLEYIILKFWYFLLTFREEQKFRLPSNNISYVENEVNNHDITIKRLDQLAFMFKLVTNFLEKKVGPYISDYKQINKTKPSCKYALHIYLPRFISLFFHLFHNYAPLKNMQVWIETTLALLENPTKVEPEQTRTAIESMLTEMKSLVDLNLENIKKQRLEETTQLLIKTPLSTEDVEQIMNDITQARLSIERILAETTQQQLTKTERSLIVKIIQSLEETIRPILAKTVHALLNKYLQNLLKLLENNEIIRKHQVDFQLFILIGYHAYVSEYDASNHSFKHVRKTQVI